MMLMEMGQSFTIKDIASSEIFLQDAAYERCCGGWIPEAIVK